MPLGNGNLAASAHHIRQTLGLTPDDVGLNIMPLFHIHGLIASLLSSMSAGAPVVCTPGFNALKFFQWFSAAGPTWYTAVPTMHQAILGRAGRNQEAVAGSRLLPHDKLSEEVAAVVVFKQDQSADAAEIRAFAGERLATFKVPSKIIVRDEIPKGATGTLQRIVLAEKLGLV